MAQSIIICGGEAKQQLTEAEKIINSQTGNTIKNILADPDVIILADPDSIKIEAVRRLKKEIQLKPFSAIIKTVLILEAEKITLPAQHALLKTLEEPPPNTLIILTTVNAELILPTILSRCRIFNLKARQLKLTAEEFKRNLAFAGSLISQSPGQRLIEADKISKEMSREFIINQIKFWQQWLRKNQDLSAKTEQVNLTTAEISRIFNNLQNSLKMLESQANSKLVIENLLLSFPYK